MKLIRLVQIASVVITAYACAMLCMMRPWLIALIAIVAVAATAKQGSSGLWAHGTARWADAAELGRAGMLGSKSGLVLGRMDVPSVKLRAVIGLFNPRVTASVACREFLAIFRKAVEQPLVRLAHAVHTAVFAPTGVGKGTSIVIPFLQSATESAVVIDIKGENAKLTQDHRRKLGHRVAVMDPFRHVTQHPDTLNPLDLIDKDSPEALDDCRDLANALVITTGQEKDPHFTESAKVWIASMIALVVYHGEPGNRSLQTVRTLLSNPAKMQAAIELMCQSDAAGGMLARMGHQLTNYKDKELASTLTTTLRFLYFLDTPAIFENTSSSSFDPKELTSGKVTVYLILPPEHMRAQASLLRMWIGTLIRAVVRNGLQEKDKVHFILDEAASLGHLESLDDAVDKFRGYGIRLLFLYQSLGQLSKCFPEGQEQTLLSNATQVFFAVNDQQTADYVSNRLGEQTIKVKSGGTNTGESRQTSDGGQGSSSRSTGASDNWAQQGRHLLKPSEVMALSPRIAITFTLGVAPIWTRLLRYYEETFVPPGRMQRLWAGVKMFTGSIFIFAVTLMLALGVTVIAHEKSQERRAKIERSFYR